MKKKNINNYVTSENRGGKTNEDLFCYDLPSKPQPQIGKILVTGATGYVGGRLVPELIARDYKVRVMVRENSPELKERWPESEIAVASASDLDSLKKALEEIHTAYYLIHSLLCGPAKFEATDIKAAVNFRIAAEEQGVKRIIYLGGLGDIRNPLSAHLENRMRVAQELKKGKVPITVLRAAIIVGSGSASYDILKHLVRNVPLFLIPSWVRTKCQPISIRDTIKYLVGVLEKKETTGKSFDIGGSDVLTYEEILKIQADLIGKKRIFLTSPISSLRIYVYFTNLLTPVPFSLIHCLMESTKNEVVCQNEDIKEILQFQPLKFKEALLRALSREEQDNVHTRWSDAYPPAHELAIKLYELKEPPQFTNTYSLLTNKHASSLFKCICMIGGKTGWFNNNWMWKLRGGIDRLLTGVGTSRGRRSQSRLRINDVIDFWRVEDLKHNKKLLLRAEMKLPGKAWLMFSINKEKEKNRLEVKPFFQTNLFFGKIYWYIFLPFHYFIFTNLIKQIESRS